MTTATPFTDRTVGELAVEIPVSIRVFEAWKIDYCCGGRTPLGEACATAGRTIEDFIHAIETAAVVPAPLARDWSGESLVALSAHICGQYHRYTREELQLLVPLAGKVLSVHGQRRPELARVVVLVKELSGDMFPHMLKEEQVLFPYVEQLENAVANGSTPPTPFFGTVKNPVRMMMAEHDRVGELLAGLREATHAYALPEDACFSYRELYRRLPEFESLTHEHVHVENNIYFPRAIALEEQSAAGHSSGAMHGAEICRH